jgi:ribonuclease P protein component
MLAKEHRLKKSQDFQKTFKKGTGFSLGSFRIRVLDKKNAMPTRIGFIVSNKCDKRASKRNSVKRLMRAETLSLICELKSGYDVVVSFQGKIETPLAKDKLRLGLRNLYQKVGIIK